MYIQVGESCRTESFRTWKKIKILNKFTEKILESFNHESDVVGFAF